MKLITFLGTGNYAETIYFLGDKQKRACFAPIASADFLEVDEILVFLTTEARQQHWADFSAQIPRSIRLHEQQIPLGKNVDELWLIFDQITTQVSPREKIAFDITHGLRSSPLVGLLVAAFLHSGLDIDIQALLYGAYDVRDTSTDPSRTPFFDLTDMLKLLDWTLAAERFNRSGDSVSLADLLDKEKKNLALKLQGDRKKMSEYIPLAKLSGLLKIISQNLNLIRTNESIQNAGFLTQQIETANELLEKSPATRPISLLMHRIEKSYQPLALENENSTEFIGKQRMLINWYVDRQQWAQAITTAREWLVNLIMHFLNLDDFTNRNTRERVEKVINSEAHEFRSAKSKKVQYIPIFLTNIPALEQILELWNLISEVRNDIDHAGFRENALSSADLIKNITKSIAQLNQIRIETDE